MTITPLDLSWLVDEFANTPIVITRLVYSYSSAGLRTSTSTTVNIKGSVQPITGDELERLGTGFHTKRLVSVWSSSAILQRDRFTFDGKSFEVQHVDNWLSGGTYFKAIAHEMDDGELA